MLKYAVTPVLALLGAAGLSAQSPADLGPKQKTEVFIQHLVKVARVDPARYRALVLEYEIGQALQEMAHEAHAGKGNEAVEEDCCAGGADSLAAPGAQDFIQSALAELHPEYAEALKLHRDGKGEEARKIALALAGKLDPYLAAHANLLLAEIGYAAADLKDRGPKDREALTRVIATCERIGQKDRLYLIEDHRACELIALAFGKLGKPLQELLQLAILLTDYNDLPRDVAERAKARLGALEGEAGRPLGTVANWMNKVEKLLAREVTAREPTQSQETEIVSALDKLIELQEARERKT